jgi:hypothetical protein
MAWLLFQLNYHSSCAGNLKNEKVMLTQPQKVKICIIILCLDA